MSVSNDKCADTGQVVITNASSDLNSTLTSATGEDQADQNMQCGSNTPANHMTGNLLKTENGNNEEQQRTHVGMHTLHMYRYMFPITDPFQYLHIRLVTQCQSRPYSLAERKYSMYMCISTGTGSITCTCSVILWVGSV